MTNPLHAQLRAWEGMHEDSPRLDAIAAKHGRVFDFSGDPWCSEGLILAALEAGHELPSDITPMARSWGNWDAAETIRRVEDLKQGDVVVLSRDIAGPQAGHVGVLDSMPASYLNLLGCNQDDRVKVSRYAKSRFVVGKRPPPLGETMNLFEQKAPGIMQDLMEALSITATDAAAIVGNLGHETGGFQHHHEIGQPSHKGGIGWAQWTGARRRSFEQWGRENGFRVDHTGATDEANLGFLLHELTETPERKVIPELRDGDSLAEKTIIFCDTFERPGVKAHSKRIAYAERALASYQANPPQPKPDTRPDSQPDIATALAAATLKQLANAIKERGAKSVLIEW